MVTITINLVNPAMDRNGFQEITIYHDDIKGTEKTYVIQVGKEAQTITQSTMNKLANVFASLKQNT